MFENKPEKETGSKSIPVLEEILINILQRQRDHGKRRPVMFPIDNLDAVNYWRGLMEPANDHSEDVEWVHTQKGGEWKTPYIDRMVYTLKKFMGLSNTHQAFIIDGIENKNTPWRGDDIDMYKSILEETQKMRIDPEKYRDNAFSVLKSFRFAQ